jgi:hypothetical protein
MEITSKAREQQQSWRRVVKLENNSKVEDQK